MEKHKYTKPTIVSLDDVAPVFGASCIIGDNPTVIPICPSTGNIATGNCDHNGNTAGSVCIMTGNTANYHV
jgi:hypothetical protein